MDNDMTRLRLLFMEATHTRPRSVTAGIYSPDAWRCTSITIMFSTSGDQLVGRP